MERQELHLGEKDRIWITAAFVGAFCDPHVFGQWRKVGLPILGRE
jgi:hypothetical protein